MWFRCMIHQRRLAPQVDFARSDPVSRGWYSTRGIFSSGLGLQLLAAQRTAWTLVRSFAFGPDRSAVDKDMLDTGGGDRRRFKCRPVGDGLGVEDSNVGIGSFSQCSTVG